MAAFHSLLRRQLRKHSPMPEVPSAGPLGFLEAVNEAYYAADAERALVERALDLSSRELLQANAELRRGMSVLRATFEATNDGILVVDVSGKLLDFNRRFAEMWNLPGSEIQAREDDATLRSILEQLEAPQAFLDKALEIQANPDAESFDTLRLKSGQSFERYSRPQRLQGRSIGRVWSFRDVTAREASEAALRASEERYRLLFDGNPQPMWVFDIETLAFLAVNDAAIRSYGYTRAEWSGMTILDIRPSEEVARLKSFLSEGPPPQDRGSAWRHRRKDGTIFDAEVTVHAIRFDGRAARLVLARDVTEKKHLEEQLRQSQKMEAVGRLAGGVAHDFNNLLTAILGYGELLSGRLGEDKRSRRELDEIRKAGRRAASLTKQLLAFSRKQVLQPKVLDLNAVVTEIERMLHRLIGEDVELKTVLAPDLVHVKADPGQLEQVIVNLAVNSRDAMPEGGRLTLKTRNVRPAEASARDVGEAPGGYVMLSVADTGCGMDSETRARLFEPFFTTKEPGKGTGLGLATVYGIVQQSGGHVSVHSEPGRGSTFEIYLPMADGASARAGVEAADEAPRTGSETVLLVEDDEAVRELTQEVLESGGYRVLVAQDGREALALCQDTNRIDALLTDVVMPGMSGLAVVRAVRELRPAIKVICMSGYTEHAILNDGLLATASAFIQKPFVPDALMRTLRSVLDAAA